MRRFEYELFADYFHFYVQDEAVDGNLADSWTEEAVAEMMAVGDGVVGIGTARNMTVPVAVEVHASEPSYISDEWDRVSECDLAVKGSRLVIAGCSDYLPDAARIDVEPGSYRVRALYAALGSLSADGLDGDDRYCVQLWRTGE